jgi:hypothetical protein
MRPDNTATFEHPAKDGAGVHSKLVITELVLICSTSTRLWVFMDETPSLGIVYDML